MTTTRKTLAALRTAVAAAVMTVGALAAPALGAVPAGEVLAILTSGGRCGVASGANTVHAGETLRAALAVTGGKGGGRPELAQGQTADPAGFFAAVRGVLSPA